MFLAVYGEAKPLKTKHKRSHLPSVLTEMIKKGNHSKIPSTTEDDIIMHAKTLMFVAIEKNGTVRLHVQRNNYSKYFCHDNYTMKKVVKIMN